MSKIVITKTSNALKVVTNDFVSVYDSYELMIPNIERINVPTGVDEVYIEFVSGKEQGLDYNDVDTVGGVTTSTRASLMTQLMLLINP